MSSNILKYEPVKWQSSFAIGVSDIDAQHQGLFRIVGRLNERLLKGGDDFRSEALEIVEALGDYTRLHFYAEELLMEENNVPGYKEHCQTHRKFEEYIRRLQTELEAIREAEQLFEMLAELGEFLNKWLTHHIQHSDQEYVPFLKIKSM